MGNSFAMNTVQIIDDTSKNKRVKKRYKMKSKHIYSSVQTNDENNDDKIYQNNKPKKYNTELSSKPKLTIDTNL